MAEGIRVIFRRQGRFVKQTKIPIIARGGQVEARVAALEKRDYPYAAVSSSFIEGAGYTGGILTIGIRTKRSLRFYNYEVPLSVWEGFYYALSKGTFYNQEIKGVYERI